MHFNNMKLVSYMVVVKRYIRNILGLYCGYQGAGGGGGGERKLCYWWGICYQGAHYFNIIH